jgi:peptidoglycan/LPS O-acetylase OafA/YrhL
VLSGFLITSLLLQEHRRAGQIRLAAFWTRRARRLLPALVLMVLAVIALRRAFAPDSVAGLRLDALAALGWVANWRFAARHTDYFAQGGMASPLQHTWSLGVEEQYYLLWPLILVAVILLTRHRRHASPAAVRRTVGWLALLGAVASAGATLRLSGSGSSGRVYFGSDTRAQALLVGAAAAALIARYWPLAEPAPAAAFGRAARALLTVAPVAGLLGLLVLAHRASGTPAQFRHGLLIQAELAAVFLIVGVTLRQQSVLARLLASVPFRFLGRISYGIYLWHWPIFLAVDGARTGLSGLALFAVRTLVTLLLASASWLLVERPINRWRPRPIRLLPLAAAAGTAAALLVLIEVPTARTGDPPIVAAAENPLAAPPAGTTGRVFARQDAALPANRAGRPLTVDVFGDSIAWTLMRYLPDTPGIRFIDRTVIGCGIADGGPYRYFGEVAQPPAQCQDWQARWGQQLAADRPDEVVLLVGRWETMDRVHDGRWTHLGKPDFDAYLAGQLDTAFTVLRSTGARLLVATEPYNHRGERPDGSLFPEDVPSRVTDWNHLLATAVAGQQSIRILDLNHRLCPTGRFSWQVDGIQVRSDGVHLTPQGVDWLTPWLITAVRAKN